MLNEVLGSVVSGRPIWRETLNECNEFHDKQLNTWHNNVRNFINWDSHAKSVPWTTPKAWKYAVQRDSFTLLFLNMTLPNNHGVWPEELGGRIYPPERSRLSKLFQEQLMADCPLCPIMPDHEKGEDAAAAAAILSEAYLFAPPWLVTSWWHGGRLGTWDSMLSRGSRPRAVIGHVHWVQSACDWHANSVKAIPALAAWHYNWTAAHVANGEHVFMCTQNSFGQPLLQSPPPRVLVMSPALHSALISVSTGLSGFQILLQWFVRIAILSGRMPVWPTLDCSAPFITNKTQNQLREGSDINAMPFGWLPYWSPNWRSVNCYWMFLMEPGCLFEGAGMTVWELEHFKHRLSRSTNVSFGSEGWNASVNSSSRSSSSSSNGDQLNYETHDSWEPVLGLNAIQLMPVVEKTKSRYMRSSSEGDSVASEVTPVTTTTISSSSENADDKSDGGDQVLNLTQVWTSEDDIIGEAVMAALHAEQYKTEPLLYLMDLPEVDIPASQPELREQYKKLMSSCNGLRCPKCHGGDSGCMPVPYS
ncbi:hypothetical protein CEUSTIGMA_g11482.t1 [Chlamydomonas eustigma]|uniref:Uncharacterized protein n=1 Tax=Chlamydomonas eustigma TaxID=1157962 RepID=A0A250XLV9_9CHLO|nr:hypothetical protein CEUSTIGMA_g11482.t1 [Chlamydomonas eustigma]|eukprot:GAX84058.1 hypothetical protein CEUSTIGMA_g11482.t1 [Chlamydomonas eustigma]